MQSPSSRRAWIEIACPHTGKGYHRQSPSSRRAWIEIDADSISSVVEGVALLAEGVDRNIMFRRPRSMPILSPSSRRAWIEIIERMLKIKTPKSPSSRRAWIEIRKCRPDKSSYKGSPSSRRAWIEIAPARHRPARRRVALLAEGVDRNRSLAAVNAENLVALLAEGVDRNKKGPLAPAHLAGRPPRGGRG